jgi:deoxyhypusine synthase
VDVIVTSAGGIEEDLIKCLAPTYRGDFSLPGALLRSKGLNRIGNLLVPNDNYCKFENWIMPLFDQMLQEQSTEVSIPAGSKLSNILLAETNVLANHGFHLSYAVAIRY